MDDTPSGVSMPIAMLLAGTRLMAPKISSTSLAVRIHAGCAKREIYSWRRMTSSAWWNERATNADVGPENDRSAGNTASERNSDSSDDEKL